MSEYEYKEEFNQLTIKKELQKVNIFGCVNVKELYSIILEYIPKIVVTIWKNKIYFETSLSDVKIYKYKINEYVCYPSIKLYNTFINLPTLNEKSINLFTYVNSMDLRLDQINRATNFENLTPYLIKIDDFTWKEFSLMYKMIILVPSSLGIMTNKDYDNILQNFSDMNEILQNISLF